ncbi:MAG: Rrf2 family transcriptional regulator [Herpetosiphon sp.]|nr:Rrf2 family transcriptional regulator [Herpetosiphon sp.]
MNSQFAVAVHILALLEYAPAPSLSSNQIAASVNTNPVVIRRILGLLKEAGLVATVCGMDGGTCLARQASMISLYDVYCATVQKPLWKMHTNPPNNDCPCGRTIQTALNTVFYETENAISHVLQKRNIADVVLEMCHDLERGTAA